MNNKAWLILLSCFAAFQAIAEPTCQLDLNKARRAGHDPPYRVSPQARRL